MNKPKYTAALCLAYSASFTSFPWKKPLSIMVVKTAMTYIKNNPSISLIVFSSTIKFTDAKVKEGCPRSRDTRWTFNIF